MLSRLFGMKRGWCLTLKKFLDLQSQSAIRQALSRFEEKGNIRKLIHGMYDYPKRNTGLASLSSTAPSSLPLH